MKDDVQKVGLAVGNPDHTITLLSGFEAALIGSCHPFLDQRRQAIKQIFSSLALDFSLSKSWTKINFQGHDSRFCMPGPGVFYGSGAAGELLAKKLNLHSKFLWQSASSGYQKDNLGIWELILQQAILGEVEDVGEEFDKIISLKLSMQVLRKQSKGWKNDKRQPVTWG